ncbi:MAG: Maf family nucleotide pyrophosphatase [Candidatus Thiodiazotropha sp. (ex Notomyrtea botanica)]|nr:Maf family nucleotide pyrophosphatase [Candidatus Thiodiazotropha sp. (ex Notomyrtea botanica)]
MAPLVYLASRSPRRRELLLQIGVPHKLLDIEVDESPRDGESPSDYVQRVSQDKAVAGLNARKAGEYLPVLAADTCVVIDGLMLGKPRDRDEGIWMLQQLSGRMHEVYTAVALDNGQLETRLSVSQVSFRPMTPVEIAKYWERGEPADKAGGYAIQGLAAMFINDLRGSYSGVMGLPLFETAELLSRAGIELLSITNNNKLRNAKEV